MALIAVAIGGTLFFGTFGYRFIPRQTAPRPDGPSFTVLSHNLLATNRNLTRVLAVIRSESADLIALQELDTPMARGLERQLADEYPYRVLRPGWADGIGVFSRFPIRSARPLSLSPAGHPAQVVAFEVPGGVLTLLNVHLQRPEVAWRRSWLPFSVPTHYDADERDRELATLLRETASLPRPLVVVGDFNLPERSVGYIQLSGQLPDAFGEVGYGLGHTFPQFGTFPSGQGWLSRRIRSVGPLLRIDYVLHSAEITALSAHVAAPTGSDHRPVVARLVVSDPAP
ncbi:MAG: endonuclease/exonuclease/phosphatase family protein [Chloroflexi bacterium]|nr:endonuclease/exonuclease/phosphatase family protein [Chloroflexota bacterium]